MAARYTFFIWLVRQGYWDSARYVVCILALSGRQHRAGRTPHDSNEPKVGLHGTKQRATTGVEPLPRNWDIQTPGEIRAAAFRVSGRVNRLDDGSATYRDRT